MPREAESVGVEASRIETGNAKAIDLIPESCGSVAVGCTDVAGIVQSVIESSGRLRAEHIELQGTVAELEADQRKVAEASDEARILSERAIERLGHGSELIHSSLGQITQLLELVDTLTTHVTGFAAAMEQVRRSSQEIDAIAETTNILALNATIEAMRAGDAGRTFAVVANEVKSLANETRRATDEIAKTVDNLGEEAGQVIGKIEAGAKASKEAKSSVASIESTLTGVTELVEEVDKQNDQIARSTSTISDHVERVQSVLRSYDEAAIESETRLSEAHGRMEDLEMTASEMFDRFVKAELSPEDSLMVDRARQVAAEITELTERALEAGELNAARLFDRDYVPIEGSNPVRFRNTLMDWAHEHWRPILDETTASDHRFQAAACTDVNGYLPTHLTKHSQEPTGDVSIDTKNCRNGRKIFDPIDKRAKRSTDPYMMAVYRQEGDGTNYVVVRNIYVPLVINGQRWGDFELAYVL
ncbi:methyl-accepting chemotaxis protein [Altererythrobacter sp. MF3-039]|uniref:methyl-accepting chemotaxis protein n=1 Tax=Altererythrobacter sp. MF3-039 TaxID=3252901 RepID=UPI00390C9D70